MIVTVTPNPAVDKVVVVHGFRAASINRATVERIDIGGKGINVAQNLARLGCEVVATGFLGSADAHGIVPKLAAAGIRSEFVPVPGEVRLNLKILDPATGQETEINETGPTVAAEQWQSLVDKVRLLARQCSVMVFSGSLPPGAPDDIYARCIEIATAAGAKTVLDTTGAALRSGIGAAPDLVKPNRAEAEELLGMRISSSADHVFAARRLLDFGARTVVLSLGVGGALSASASGMWYAIPPELTVRNTIGAGDAMVAALAFGLSQSQSAPEVLRLATALSSAAAASAAPVPPLDLFQRMLPHVTIEAASLGESSADAPEVLS